MRTRIDGVEYEIQTYQGKHSHEYLLSETKDGKVEGRCQLFRHGILSLAWTVKNGKREGEITEYFDGKALHRENWKSIFGEDGNRRMIENTLEGLVMTIRCPVKHGMNDEEENEEIVIYRGGYDKEMNRHGHGIEYDIESGKEKLEGYWEKDKLVRIIREFDIESNQMIEYVVNDNLELWNRIPVYVGGYCMIDGTFVRNGIGYLIEENSGTAIRESEWNNGIEKIGLDLYEGWYMKGLQESIRSVLKNRKPEEIKNETSDIIGNTVTIKKSEELIIIDKKVSDLVISSNTCSDIKKLHLNQFNWLRSIVIGDGCFKSVKSFELNGLSRLKTLKIGNSSFGNTEWMNLSNLISLESIEIGNNSFEKLKSFELNGLSHLKTLKIGNSSFGNTELMNLSSLISLESLEIGNNSFEKLKSFDWNGLSHLKTLKIGNSSFGNTELMNLSSLISLESLEIGNNSFEKLKSFDWNGLNRLKTLKISNSSFGKELMNLSKLISLESIEIGDDCFESVQTFKIDGLNRLKTIKIGNNSFTQRNGNDSSKSFHILNCESLESIKIGQYSFSDFGGEFELKNLPQLLSIQFGAIRQNRSFGIGNSNEYVSCNFCCSSFVIRGIELILNIVMIRSSKTTNYYLR